MKLTCFVLVSTANCIVSALVVDTFTFIGGTDRRDELRANTAFTLQSIPEVNTYIDHLSLPAFNHTDEATSANFFVRDMRLQLESLQDLVNQSIGDPLSVLDAASAHSLSLEDLLGDFINAGNGNTEAIIPSILSEWCSQILPNVFMSAQQIAIIHPTFAISGSPQGPTVCPTFDIDSKTYPMVS